LNVRPGLYHFSSAYVRISRYFFLALAVIGLLGTITGVFAQSTQVQLTLSNAACPATSASRAGVGYACYGTVEVTSQLSNIALRGNVTYVVSYGNYSSYTGVAPLGFTPSNMVYGPTTSVVNASASFVSYLEVSSSTMYVQAYDPSNPSTVYATVEAPAPISFPSQGRSSEANLFILAMEIPLFQVPQLGISAGNPDFKTLFATFDQLPLGDFYMLFARSPSSSS